MDISIPRLPTSVNLDENEHFHPPAIHSIQAALKELGLENEFQISRQLKDTAGGLVDLAIVCSKTQRPLVPIEIKKTLADVRGKGRRQAKDYRDNLPNRLSDIYVSTNLELVETFRWSPNRSATLSQLLATEYREVGSINSHNSNEFYYRLKEAFKEVVSIALGNESPTYQFGLYEIELLLTKQANDLDNWHESFAPLAFESIRSFAHNANVLPSAKQWSPAKNYLSQPSEFHRRGRSLNFKEIFDVPPGAKVPRTSVTSGMLDAISTEYSITSNVESFSSLVMENIKSLAPGEGIVETDPDLSRLLSKIVLRVLGSDEMPTGSSVLDPAAGNGRLLLDFADQISTPPAPDMVMAIEHEPRFREILSLNLGLKFNRDLSPKCSPIVKISPFQWLPIDEFKNVGIVLVNPPYQSYARSNSGVTVFTDFRRAFEDTVGESSIFDRGQPSLEMLYIENIVRKVPDGTIIGCIVPYKHLSSPGADAKKYRDFLLNEMGLCNITQYSREGLFADHVVETVILVGKVRHKPQAISIIPNGFKPEEICSGTSELYENHIEIENFESLVSQGWKSLLVREALQAYDFLEELFSQIPYSHLSDLDIRRGKFGNSGGSDELSFSSNLKNNLEKDHTEDSLFVPLQRSNGPSRLVQNESWSGEWTIPAKNDAAKQLLRKIIDNREPTSTKGVSTAGQRKEAKTPEDILNIAAGIAMQQRNAVIIPRGARNSGHIGVHKSSKYPVAYSTNYGIVQLSNLDDCFILASYLGSVFGQISFELIAKPEAGLRKIEMTGMRMIKVPVFSGLGQDQRKRLIELWNIEGPLVLADPIERESDLIWSEFLHAGHSADLRTQAISALADLVSIRVPSMQN